MVAKATGKLIAVKAVSIVLAPVRDRHSKGAVRPFKVVSFCSEFIREFAEFFSGTTIVTIASGHKAADR
jgi:hypothetical protein